MPAVLIYVPGGKIYKWAYEGALQQAKAMKKAMGENTEMIGMINIDHSNHEAETKEDRAKAERFVRLARSGIPVIAMIPAGNIKRRIIDWLKLCHLTRQFYIQAKLQLSMHLGGRIRRKNGDGLWIGLWLEP
jgi:hypothetical protein